MDIYSGKNHYIAQVYTHKLKNLESESVRTLVRALSLDTDVGTHIMSGRNTPKDVEKRGKNIEKKLSNELKRSNSLDTNIAKKFENLKIKIPLKRQTLKRTKNVKWGYIPKIRKCGISFDEQDNVIDLGLINNEDDDSEDDPFD